MGLCLSATNQNDPPLHHGAKSRCVRQYGNHTSRSGGKIISTTVHSTIQTEGQILPPTLRSFCYNELKAATLDFHPFGFLGEGDFGCVYKGWIDENSLKAKPTNGTIVAVKKLDQSSCQGQQEWLSEIKYLGQLYHPNIVKLIGYSSEGNERLLVYEYMPNGSLDDHLFGWASNIKPLSWNQRMKIALGAAKGLAFLHSKADVIYRNFNTSNVLLDSNYNAKLSDFGLAKDGPMGSKVHVSTRILGTDGYFAPEYQSSGRLTIKGDVYSFGVVLLEMLSGKQVIDIGRPLEERNLVEWARPYLGNKSNLFRVLDANIVGQDSLRSALKVVDLAVQCLSMQQVLRPTMEEVANTLEQVLAN